jgi:hypothetical protein
MTGLIQIAQRFPDDATCQIIFKIYKNNTCHLGMLRSGQNFFIIPWICHLCYAAAGTYTFQILGWDSFHSTIWRTNILSENLVNLQEYLR